MLPLIVCQNMLYGWVFERHYIFIDVKRFFDVNYVTNSLNTNFFVNGNQIYIRTRKESTALLINSLLTMYRQSNTMWLHFSKLEPSRGFKRLRKMQLCYKTVSTTSINMRTHDRNFKSVPNTIGALSVTEFSQSAAKQATS